MKFNSADSLLVPRGAGIMLTLVAPTSPVTALGLVRHLCLAHPLRHQVRPPGHHQPHTGTTDSISPRVDLGAS